MVPLPHALLATPAPPTPTCTPPAAFRPVLTPFTTALLTLARPAVPPAPIATGLAVKTASPVRLGTYSSTAPATHRVQVATTTLALVASLAPLLVSPVMPLAVPVARPATEGCSCWERSVRPTAAAWQSAVQFVSTALGTASHVSPTTTLFAHPATPLCTSSTPSVSLTVLVLTTPTPTHPLASPAYPLVLSAPPAPPASPARTAPSSSSTLSVSAVLRPASHVKEPSVIVPAAILRVANLSCTSTSAGVPVRARTTTTVSLPAGSATRPVRPVQGLALLPV